MEKSPKQRKPEEDYYEEYIVEKSEDVSALISSEVLKNERGEAIERLKYEYRDAEGNLLGAAIVEQGLDATVITGLKTVKGEEKPEGRVLKKFELVGRDAEGERPLDIMKLCNPHNTRIIVANELLSNYHYSDYSKTAIVPPLDSPLNIGIFLHELGHADQYHDEKFKDIAPLYMGQIVHTEMIMGQIKKAYEAVPEAASIMSERELEKALTQLSPIIQKTIDANTSVTEKENDNLALKYDRDAATTHFIAGRLNILSWDRLKLDLHTAENDVKIAEIKKQDAARIEKEKVGELLSKLEAAGFRFTASVVPAEKGGPSPRLSLEEIKDLDAIDDIFVAVNNLNDDYCKMRFREPDKLTVKLPVDIGMGERRIIVLELNVPAEDYLQFEEKREECDRQLLEGGREISALKKELDAKTEELKKELAASGLQDILSLPTRKMERDATYRALRWLKRIRDKSGVNLLQELRIEEGTRSAGLADASCEDSVRQGFHMFRQGKNIMTILEELKHALGLYGAEHPPHTQRKKK